MNFFNKCLAFITGLFMVNGPNDNLPDPGYVQEEVAVISVDPVLDESIKVTNPQHICTCDQCPIHKSVVASATNKYESISKTVKYAKIRVKSIAGDLKKKVQMLSSKEGKQRNEILSLSSEE